MLFMGIDVGSSGCKTSVMDETGRVICFASREYAFTYQDGRCELDANVVWEKVSETLRELGTNHDLKELKTVSVTSFGEMFVLLNEKKQVLAPSISYEDTRGEEELASLNEPDRLYRITGANPDVMFALPKLMWIKKHKPEVYANARYLCMFADYILFRMGAEHHTDYSLAARTLMLDVTTKTWSKEILSMAEIHDALLGKLVASGTKVGEMDAAIAEQAGLPKGILLLAGGHDQPCAALGAGIVASGDALDGMGSNECIVPAFGDLMIHQTMQQSNLVCVPHIIPDLYVTYAFNRTAGSLLRWYHQIIGETDYQKVLNEMPEEPTELLVLPHFAGAATPYMDNTAVGGIVGLKLSTTRGMLTRGIIEGLNYEMLVNLHCLKDAGFSVQRLYVSGGMAKSGRILQIKADVLGIPVMRLSNTETGTVGTAILGSVAMGLYPDCRTAAAALVKAESMFLPNQENHNYYQKQFKKYQKMYQEQKELCQD
ncbi:MAG: hypothetical protein IKW60_05015 [Clostridia bacterium]|nr:hypothetical protein [Clostridia bacterium]